MWKVTPLNVVWNCGIIPFENLGDIPERNVVSPTLLVLVTSVMKHIVVSQEKVNQKTVWPRSCSRLTKSGGDKSSL
ncbi:hypothetical protein BLOT_003698 [Blomia tropicalis]|nr:hypothetical protein BLOT_003698 [Blomia tropicalis]